MIVVLDACVLYPAPLRDFLLHLSALDVIQARWTNEIHDEWVRNLLAARPELSEEKLSRTRSLMDLHTRDCLVEDYQHLIDGLRLPDPDDRHVLAAAIQCGATAIITFNLRDFPKKALGEFGIVAVEPDGLICGMFDENAEDICLAFQRQLANLKNPPLSRAELLAMFERVGLAKTTKLLENC